MLVISLAHCAEHRLMGLRAGIGAQLFEIVTGAESGAGAGEDHDAHILVGGDRFERRLQRAHHVDGQRVARARPVEGQRRDAVAILAQDQSLIAHRHLLGSPEALARE